MNALSVISIHIAVLCFGFWIGFMYCKSLKDRVPAEASPRRKRRIRARAMERFAQTIFFAFLIGSALLSVYGVVNYIELPGAIHASCVNVENGDECVLTW